MSQASELIPIMHDRLPCWSRVPTARSSAERLAQSERTAVRAATPGLIVTTRKIAALVRGATTGWGIARGKFGAPVVGIGSPSSLGALGLGCGNSARGVRRHGRSQ